MSQTLLLGEFRSRHSMLTISRGEALASPTRGGNLLSHKAKKLLERHVINSVGQDGRPQVGTLECAIGQLFLLPAVLAP